MSTTLSERGLAGLIVPDLPVEESAQLAAICRHRDVSLIQLVTPTTPRERAVRIAETSTGFLVLRLGGRHHRRADRSCRRSWSTTSAGCARKPTCRSASASASAGRST